MRFVQLFLDGEAFVLASDEDIDQLQVQIIDAVVRGAAFVEFGTMRQGRVSVLITGRSSVVFSVQQYEDADTGMFVLPASVADPDLYRFT